MELLLWQYIDRGLYEYNHSVTGKIGRNRTCVNVSVLFYIERVSDTNINGGTKSTSFYSVFYRLNYYRLGSLVIQRSPRMREVAGSIPDRVL